MINFGFANSAPKKELTDVLQEINKLSPVDKDCLLNDLYGIRANKDQSKLDNNNDDDRISNGLKEFEESVQEFVNTRGIDDVHVQYYIRAKDTAPEFVNGRSLKIQFLRSEEFNTTVRLQISVVIGNFFFGLLLYTNMFTVGLLCHCYF
jgi:hypothetical protein